jgi:hypothetical protein
MENIGEAMEWMLFSFFDTTEVDLYRSITSEDIDHDFEHSFLSVDFDDFSFTSLEWTSTDSDELTDLHISLVLFALFLEDSLELLEFCTTDWNWDSTRSEETSDIRSIADDIPALIGDNHLDEDISWENIFLFLDLDSALSDRDAIMSWDKYVDDMIFESKCFSTLHE